MLSRNVCLDINTLKDLIPENDKCLLRRLTDKFLCEIMCDGEFEKACQVLLWSFEVQKRISSVNDAQNNEQISDSLQNAKEKGKNNIPIETTENDNKKLSNSAIDKIVPEKHPEHTDENNLAPSIINGKISTDLAKDSSQVTYPRIKNQQIEMPEDVNISNDQNKFAQIGQSKSIQNDPNKSVQNGLNKSVQNYPNKSVQRLENHVTLISTNVDEKEQIDINGATLDLNKNDLTRVDSTVEGSNTITENEQSGNDKDATGDNSENAANGKVEHAVNNNEKTKNTDVSNKNKTQTVPIDNDQNIYDNAKNTDITGEHIQKNANEDTAINKNEINENNQHQSNTHIISKTDKIDEKNQNQAKAIITTQGNIINKTENTLTDEKANILVKTEESDRIVPDYEKTSAKVSHKASTKDSAISKDPISKPDLSVVTESPSQAVTETTVALEKMEGDNDGHQLPDKDPDQYTNDSENNGDEDEYSRHDYGGNLYESSKTEESNPDIPNTADVPAPKEVVMTQNEKPMEFPARDSFGHESNDIQMIAAFPEQEDSHFFFYFLSIVLILMAGYLIFHNKQKIIALIVEGRHERNRRSHRAGYKKLETK
ncbi:uncharacterized protein NPIL_89451 [Nephila pilipes]|uniref:Uncharacterized protein n=1 Tax=Nephila pilipes TaxID=299642 RepID=A0A8X6N107_NEPPI|nr:uncharacterized protein NPIL_89451 [Nephila pilipes]